jgi:hypothetical protein
MSSFYVACSFVVHRVISARLRKAIASSGQDGSAGVQTARQSEARRPDLKAQDDDGP